MLNKFSFLKLLPFATAIVAVLSLSFFNLYKLPSGTFSSLSGKVFLISTFALLLSIVYVGQIFFLKEVHTFQNRFAKIALTLISVVAILSAIFSKESSNAFFGETFAIDSVTSILAFSLIGFFAVLASKYFSKLTWIIFIAANLLLTLPVMLAIVSMKLKFIKTANFLTSFTDSWDTVAAISALLAMIALVYLENIAFNRVQKILAGVIIGLHMLLVAFIVMPDTWYALTVSSLLIMLLGKNAGAKFYKKTSFYIFLLSLAFSIALTFSSLASTKISDYATKISNINYTFVKPSLTTSLSIDWHALKEGKVLGVGPSRYHTLWRAEKPKEIVNSNFWDTDFSSSYSAMTTAGGTMGVLGIAAIFAVIALTKLAIWRSVRSQKFKDLEDEDRFYLLGSIVTFVFGSILLFVFGNVNVSIVLFVAGLAFVAGQVISIESRKVNKLDSVLSIILLLVLLSSFVVLTNRLRATLLYTSSVSTFGQDKDFNKLETSLIKVANISNDDYAYRALSQFYIEKAQNILTKATNPEVAQKEFVAAANASIKAAQNAVALNKYNYNNYMSLGASHELQSIVDKQASYVHAKEAYTKAKDLYPNNPYIPLVLARLEWSNSKDVAKAAENVNSSLQIKQNYSLAYYLLSQLSVQNNDKKGAMDFALKAIATDGTNLNAYTQYGILALNNKNLSESELAFLSVLKIDGGNVNAIYYLAITYILAGKYDVAQDLVNALNIKLPNTKEVQDLQTYLNQSKFGPVATNQKDSKNTKNTKTATSTKKK